MTKKKDILLFVIDLPFGFCYLLLIKINQHAGFNASRKFKYGILKEGFVTPQSGSCRITYLTVFNSKYKHGRDRPRRIKSSIRTTGSSKFS
jgi:hypothetical protein